jgi:hypothetical protein
VPAEAGAAEHPPRRLLRDLADDGRGLAARQVPQGLDRLVSVIRGDEPV